MKTLIHPHQLKDPLKKVYELNELQIHAFDTFTQIISKMLVVLQE
jgi:hypothetical protein